MCWGSSCLEWLLYRWDGCFDRDCPGEPSARIGAALRFTWLVEGWAEAARWDDARHAQLPLSPLHTVDMY